MLLGYAVSAVLACVWVVAFIGAVCLVAEAGYRLARWWTR